MERPQAQITQMLYNANTSKKAKALGIDKFYLYQPEEAKNVAAPRYANAAMALVKMGLFPSWALFCFKDLTAQSNELTPPEVLCYQSDSAILLAPRLDFDARTVHGLLIALEESSQKNMTLVSESGDKIVAQMPHIPTKVVAEDDVTLTVLAIHNSSGP